MKSTRSPMVGQYRMDILACRCIWLDYVDDSRAATLYVQAYIDVSANKSRHVLKNVAPYAESRKNLCNK